jgi:ATP-binding cassette, subfamily B, bacterial
VCDRRALIGAMLGAIGESVVGAAVIRAHGAQARTLRRLDDAIDAARVGQTRAQRTAVMASQVGEAAAAIATGAVVVVGVLLGAGGGLRIGELTAFLFLVALFVQPVQVATEVLNEAQNAVAGWRRVLDVLDTEPDVADPGPDGVALPAGPIEVAVHGVEFAYPGGPSVLSEVDLVVPAGARVAVVGETGSGKTTLAKLMTRLMDPTGGRILLSGVDLRRVGFAVPQDGILFDASIATNVRYGRPEATDADLAAAFADLGLAGWVDGLPDGLGTRVGERGEALSVGERQLVALVRAFIADPDLLVLDEATSAVDPATEVRLQQALDVVSGGRTTVVIAHRMSTARAADEVIVVDRGRVVQRGPHAALLAQRDSVYARLYTAWLEQQR